MLDSGLMCNTVCNRLMDWMGAGSEIDNSSIVKRHAGRLVRKARKKTAVLVSVWIN